MKLKNIYILLTAVSIIFLAFFSKEPGDENRTNKEVINFSHSFHSDLAECSDCHSAVLESKSLKDRLLPDHENCSNCHEVDDDEECATCHIDENYEALIQTESSLIFNHKFHLNNEMNCEDCHKGLDEVDYSFESANLFPPMETCASCHNEIKIASNACESCHISTYNLLPDNHRNVDFTRAHKFMAWESDANCMMCHDNITCQECHVTTNVITEINTTDDFYQPYMPGNSIDGAEQQIITKVHNDPNYRFYHGIDAKGRTTDCQTCHQVESFCANCHQSENSDFALGGIIPASHLLPNFKTIGIGSGGGEHSILAKRDLESCASCHDVQGADPTCIMCHLDSDGIENTNPKTHASNFMRNEHGDWHDNYGSICYNCHTSASPDSQPTDGFCNYCHGL
jgi:hypothetical protein